MASTDEGIEAKIVLLGDSGVGKSAIALRYVKNQFIENNDPTVGACFFTKRVSVNSTQVKLQIWDTAGQERFRALAPMYYHGAVAAILVYDTTQPKSFQRVRSWAEELSRNVSEELVVAVVGSKLDLYDALPASQRQASVVTAAHAYADELGAVCFETSAKENRGIEQLFAEVTRRVVNLRRIASPPPRSTSPAMKLHASGSSSGQCYPGSSSSSGGSSGCAC
eukprot:m51a1_g6965 hypothetical protein (223) ;mRNA; r:88263-89432